MSLAPLFSNLAARRALPAYLILNKADTVRELSSAWVLITENTDIVEDQRFPRRVRLADDPAGVYWTDDFNNLLDVVIWKE